jgi:hypothetical protein
LVGRYSEMKDEDSVSCMDPPILSSKTPSEVDLEQPPTREACGDMVTGQEVIGKLDEDSVSCMDPPILSSKSPTPSDAEQPPFKRAVINNVGKS